MNNFRFLNVLIFFISIIGSSQNNGYKLSSLYDNETNTAHYSLIENVTFPHDCIKEQGEEKIICIEKSLANLLIKNIVNTSNYSGVLYLYFNTDYSGKIYNIRSRSFPTSAIIKRDVEKQLKDLKFAPGLYLDKTVNVVYYTKLKF
ncbi:MAG TPA: hypothetical protein PKH16_00235 [Aequorivita sp.]|nr:hypothetical protein [Aequorivita sp.]